jgi:hypothetical protein
MADPTVPVVQTTTQKLKSFVTNKYVILAEVLLLGLYFFKQSKKHKRSNPRRVKRMRRTKKFYRLRHARKHARKHGRK